MNKIIYSICLWDILAANIVNALIGKDINVNLSEFNAIGAKSKLKNLD